MMSLDIVYDVVHPRHDPRWMARPGPADGGGPGLCLACVVQMMETDDVSVRDRQISFDLVLFLLH